MTAERPPAFGPRVVPADAAHLDRIAAIYAAEVRASPATFDLEPPGAGHWTDALAAVDAAAGRLLLAALDREDEVLGFAKSGRFRDRAAYASTCEVSAYVAEEARGRGVATALYRRLLELLDGSPLRLATAAITEPNPASTALHLRFGFTRVGTFDGVGLKFGRAWSVTWYQRPLAAATRSPAGGP